MFPVFLPKNYYTRYIKTLHTNRNVDRQLFTPFLDNLFDKFNTNICIWSFVFSQSVHQHYLEMVCFSCHIFLNLISSEDPSRDGEREGDEGGREGRGEMDALGDEGG